MKSIITCVSQTNKPAANQDFCTTIVNDKAGIKGVIVADGIGSHASSELSSKFCVERLKEKIEAVENSSEINFKELFTEINAELAEYASQKLPEEILKHNPLGTTLICTLELEDRYIFSYVGNGSIWQISGNFNHFSLNRYLPWNVNNLLTPHTYEEEGKSVLYKFMSITPNISCSPTVLTINKDDTYGDIILITTDGIYTNDEAKIGKDDNDVIWIMGEETMVLLYEKLNLFFENNLSNEELEEELQKYLEEYLSELKSNQIMHDDTTLGIIISPETVLYQQERYRSLKTMQDEADTNT